jgi:hypothetical protein
LIIDLVNGNVKNKKVQRRSEVRIDEGETSHDHRKVDGDVASEPVVVRLQHVEVVISPNIKKRKQTAVNPSSSLTE